MSCWRIASDGIKETPDTSTPMKELVTAILLAIALEGMLYTLFPGGLKRVMEMVQEIPESQLRIGGLVAAIVAIGAIWAVRIWL